MENEFDHRMLCKHAFGLVDPSAIDNLPDGITTKALVPRILSASPHLMPRLIDFRSMPDTLALELLEGLYSAKTSLQAPPIQLLVATEASAEEFARRWNALQLVSTRSGQRYWLRLHDPRVLHQLLRMLTPAKRPELFSRIKALTYWIGGEWITARADDDVRHQNPLMTKPYRASFGWDWQRIERIGLINRALLGAGITYPQALTSQGALAEQLMTRAEARHGLTTNADLVEFAIKGLTTSATFDEHTEIASVIGADTDPTNESTLADRLALIEEDIWTQLRPPANTIGMGQP